MLDVLENIVLKVVDTVDMSPKMGVKVGWIDKILREVSLKMIIAICFETLYC